MSEVRTITDESLAQAVEIIRDGGLIVIPTDTVYGVACDPRNVEAIRKIYMVKQRPKSGRASARSSGAVEPAGRHVHAGRVLADCRSAR